MLHAQISHCWTKAPAVCSRRWERLQDEYNERHHEPPINELAKKELLEEIIPEDIENILDVQTML